MGSGEELKQVAPGKDSRKLQWGGWGVKVHHEGWGKNRGKTCRRVQVWDRLALSMTWGFHGGSEARTQM